MKNFKIASVLFFFTATLFLFGCSDNSSSPPEAGVTVYQAGYAIDGDQEVPVWWNGKDTPTRLPMLSFGNDCPPNGSVEAMTLAGEDIVMVGISSLCIGDQFTMKPVFWHQGIVTQLAFPYTEDVQGAAYDVAYYDESLYIVGATGSADPQPILWIDGEPVELPLEDDYEHGEATNILFTEDSIYISGYWWKGNPIDGTLTVIAGYWKHDITDIYSYEWTTLMIPDEADRVQTPLPLALAGQDVWVGFTVYSSENTGLFKPAISENGGTPIPFIDFDFENDTSGQVMDLVSYESSILSVGAMSRPDQYDLDGPVLWTDTVAEDLSTIDDSLGLGKAYAINLLDTDIYVSGHTYMKDPDDETTLIAVPAYWKNGNRHDRQGLDSDSSDPSAFAQAIVVVKN